ncbi:MAG TPA: GNAT family N-acetyltransferase [Pseudonocardia sp.]|nr:GNAT family N-acetyltransferase [Pseudonocardia sp.]
MPELGPGSREAPGSRTIGVRVADERDGAALAQLRRVWVEERTGRPVVDPGFEAGFAQWWRTEQPRRTFWLAEVGSERSGYTAIGSINVVEIVHMPRPGGRGGRVGQVGNAFVLNAFSDQGVPQALLEAVIVHARERRYRRLVLAPTARSLEFYRRAGFRPAGETLLALDPGEFDPG